MVFRPDSAPANTSDEADDQDQDDPGARWVEVASRVVGPTGPRFGRWQQVIVDSLAEHDAVGLPSLVEGHLGRKATKAESVAAHRAAHLLAGSGRARLARVRVPPAKGRRGGILLVVVRPDLAPTDMRMIATRYVAPADRTQEALETIVASCQAAAANIDDVQLYTVEAEQAHRTAHALALPLRQLTQLRQSLIMRRP